MRPPSAASKHQGISFAAMLIFQTRVNVAKFVKHTTLFTDVYLATGCSKALQTCNWVLPIPLGNYCLKSWKPVFTRGLHYVMQPHLFMFFLSCDCFEFVYLLIPLFIELCNFFEIVWIKHLKKKISVCFDQIWDHFWKSDSEIKVICQLQNSIARVI